MLDIQAAADLTDDWKCVIGVRDVEDRISPVWLFRVRRWQADKDVIAPVGYRVRHIPNFCTDQYVRATSTWLGFGGLRLGLRNLDAAQHTDGHDNCAHDLGTLHILVSLTAVRARRGGGRRGGGGRGRRGRARARAER